MKAPKDGPGCQKIKGFVTLSLTPRPLGREEGLEVEAVASDAISRAYVMKPP